MDEIQRWLRANLQTLRSERAREDWFHNLPTAPEALSFWLRIAVDLSATEPWWYDTLVEYARRRRNPDGQGTAPALPSVVLDWCVGVAANDISRPKHHGRPPNELRDRLICAAVEAYMNRAREGGAMPHDGGRDCFQAGLADYLGAVRADVLPLARISRACIVCSKYRQSHAAS